MFKEKKGEGGFGRAFVIYDRETKKEFISKFIIIEEDKKNDKESIRHKNELFKREIDILNDLKQRIIQTLFK